MIENNKQSMRERSEIYVSLTDGETLTKDRIKEIFKGFGKIKSLALKEQREDIVDIIVDTQNQYWKEDKKTQEMNYSGAEICRGCGKRKDSLEVDEIIKNIKQDQP
jgi:hypothetical protein